MAEYMNILVRAPKIYHERRRDLRENFKTLYRFEMENVNWLADHFLEATTETHGGALTHVDRMKVFLRYVGDPGFQTGVGEDIGIYQTTVCKVIWDVCNKITAKHSTWIKFPATTEELENAKEEWQMKYNFPCAIGAIDCSHFSIKKPPIHGDEYINRKGVATLNVQATCNTNEWFTSVDCSWPGSVHDSRIWKNSALFEIINENAAGALLLADEGYALTPWMMTPCRNPCTANQRIYNKLNTKERVIIERSI